MKVLKTVAILSVAGIIGTMAVYAEDIKEHKCMVQEKRGMMHHFKGKHQKMKRIMKQLDLSSKQKTALKENRKEMREKMMAKRKAMMASTGMSQFISVSGVDRDSMVNFAVERATERANARADMMEKTLNILSPEQKTKFVSLLKAEHK
jgi:Spy/CpxP family protein refolding chaperone